MKIAMAVAAAMLFFGTTAFADGNSTLINVTATSICTFGATCPTATLEAQMTVMPVTGTFFNSGEAIYFQGTEDEVTAIAGTVNGYAMSWTPPVFGDGSWLTPGSFDLGTVYFAADGFTGWIEDAPLPTLIAPLNGSLYNFDVTWSASDPRPAPEPSSLLLSAMGLFGVIGLARKLATR